MDNRGTNADLGGLRPEEFILNHSQMTAALKAEGYVCREKLGEGAFSEVYRVEDEKGDSFACKVSGAVRLLEKEAGIMKELRHPLFPEFHMFRSMGGLGYLIMEHISGCCLEAVLRRRGGFSPRQVARIGIELAEGLGYLHERGGRRLFRDVKPANIIVRQDGRVKLLDLGCVCPRGRRADSRAGTPGYCAPEQLAEGAALTEACDVYGLGRTLLDTLGREEKAGLRPGAGRRQKADHRPRHERTERKKLIGLLEACTRQDPSLRIADMRTVIAELLELEGGRGAQWRQEALCRKNIWERDCEKP